MKIFLSLLLGYLFGSIPFAVIISYLKGIKILEVGTKNPGAANVFREVGKVYGIIVWFLDTVKPIIPMYLSRFLFNLHSFYVGLVGIFAFIGHCWSIFLRFKGGKGASTSGGILFFLFPKFFPVSLFLYYITRKSPRNPFLIISIFLIGFLIVTIQYREEIKWVIPFFIIFLSIGILANIETLKQMNIKRE